MPGKWHFISSLFLSYSLQLILHTAFRSSVWREDLIALFFWGCFSDSCWILRTKPLNIMYKVKTPDMTHKVLHNWAFACLLGLSFFSCSTRESHEPFCRVLNVLFTPPPHAHILPLHSLVISHAAFFPTFNYPFSTPHSVLNLEIPLPVQRTSYQVWS